MNVNAARTREPTTRAALTSNINVNAGSRPELPRLPALTGTPGPAPSMPAVDVRRGDEGFCAMPAVAVRRGNERMGVTRSRA